MPLACGNVLAGVPPGHVWGTHADSGANDLVRGCCLGRNCGRGPAVYPILRSAAMNACPLGVPSPVMLS
jgi:hypothetical protein